MGFTCILLTNTFLVGRYWDFKSPWVLFGWASWVETTECTYGPGDFSVHYRQNKSLVVSDKSRVKFPGEGGY